MKEPITTEKPILLPDARRLRTGIADVVGWQSTVPGWSRRGLIGSSDLAESYISMTLSAIIMSDSKILRPTTFAVLPLMTASSFVGCSAGDYAR
jgi:hypothetical protein